MKPLTKKLTFVIVLLALFTGLFGILAASAAPFDVDIDVALEEPPTLPLFPGGILPEINIGIGGTDDPEAVVTTLQVLLLISLISLAPSLLVLLTGFVRIVIMLSFTRQAMATQQIPPNQVLIGIALFLTIFIMTPVFNEINQNALIPFSNGELSTEQALEYGMAPIRRFMFDQLGETAHGDRSLELFHNLANIQMDRYDLDSVPNTVLIPAFILNELTMGFLMGFIIYLPFIVVDMVVASVLMSMGMMMLPPAMISLPFKIMVFILAGGWEMVIENMLRTFRL
jgi:flagellar biosynthetic protein FliP